MSACAARFHLPTHSWLHLRTCPHTFNSSTPILPLPQGVYEKEGKSLPHDLYEQMRLAVSAVFGSWNTTRAVKYR